VVLSPMGGERRAPPDEHLDAELVPRYVGSDFILVSQRTSSGRRSGVRMETSPRKRIRDHPSVLLRALTPLTRTRKETSFDRIVCQLAAFG